MNAILLATLSLALPLTAFSAPEIRLTCVTEYPTTSFDIRTEGKEVLATIIHHHGVEYAPAIVGIYTPHDLPILEEQAKLVRKMPDRTTFRWPVEKCRATDEQRFECFGSEDVQDGRDGSKLRPFALYTTRKTEEGIAGRFDYLTVRATFSVDGKDASVEMQYDKVGCFRPLPGTKRLR